MWVHTSHGADKSKCRIYNPCDFVSKHVLLLVIGFILFIYGIFDLKLLKESALLTNYKCSPLLTDKLFQLVFFEKLLSQLVSSVHIWIIYLSY